jgi:hypothetical protein
MLKREKDFHAVLTIDPSNAVSTAIAFRGSDGRRVRAGGQNNASYNPRRGICSIGR